MPLIRFFRSFRRPELIVVFVLLLLLNAPVLIGSCWHSLIFQPEAVGQGQWWRILTHPLVHVTWYHLLLDGSAFLILYQSLLETSILRRLAYVLAAAGGSLVAAWTSPAAGNGLCGLSGIAHGLMAVSALEITATQPPGSPERRVGLASFILVVAKAAFEALTGRMFFAFLDFGLLGSPVAVSHAGGIVGALIAFSILHGRATPREHLAVFSRAPDRISPSPA
jgi:rhomboid family GlyGly-CTERM serine protease